MAQTITNVSGQILGMPGYGAGTPKFGAVNCANSNPAGETNYAINWSTYGINTVLLWGCKPGDATATVPYASLVVTTVTYTWGTDVSNILLWAIGE